MVRRAEKRKEQSPAVVEMRERLARQIAAHAPEPGANATPIPGLSLYRRTTPTACFLATYEPSLTVFAPGPQTRQSRRRRLPLRRFVVSAFVDRRAGREPDR